MEDVNHAVRLVEELGFPIFIAVTLMAGMYFMLKWMMSVLLNKIQALWDMTVKMIDRLRSLDNSIVRLETMIRLMKDIEPDWERMGKLDHQDKRKD